MKKFILGFVVSTLPLSAFAQTAANSDTVTINAAPHSNGATGKRSMTPGEFNTFSGSYELANGKSLSLFCRGLKKYAKVQDEAWREIVATSSHSFVSLDQHLSMNIERSNNGDVSGELLIRGDQDSVAAENLVEHVAIVAAR